MWSSSNMQYYTTLLVKETLHLFFVSRFALSIYVTFKLSCSGFSGHQFIYARCQQPTSHSSFAVRSIKF